MSHHSEETPWVPAEAGNLIKADDWNDAQRLARAEIKQSAGELEEKINEVEEMLDDVDATKFGGRTPEEWREEFAPAVHDHEGETAYRRYIKEFTGELNKVFLEHSLSRYPLVDVYELLDVSAEFPGCKMLFYYGKEDADAYNLWVRVFRDRRLLGLPFEQVLDELGVEYEDDDVIEDVIDEMWRKLMEDPNDTIQTCTTPWVDECCGQRRTVGDLKRADQWNDLYLAIRPRKCGKGADTFQVGDNEVEVRCQVEVTHISYDTLHIEAFGLGATAAQPLDLMFLLRS